MTVAPSTSSARPLVLQRDGACLPEGVARRDGCRRNWARTKPRTTITNRPHHNPERLVEKVGRSITNSETPHPPADGPEPTPSATSPTTPHAGPSRRRQRLLIDVVHTVRRPHPTRHTPTTPPCRSVQAPSKAPHRRRSHGETTSHKRGTRSRGARHPGNRFHSRGLRHGARPLWRWCSRPDCSRAVVT